MVHTAYLKLLREDFYQLAPHGKTHQGTLFQNQSVVKFSILWVAIYILFGFFFAEGSAEDLFFIRNRAYSCTVLDNHKFSSLNFTYFFLYEEILPKYKCRLVPFFLITNEEEA